MSQSNKTARNAVFAFVVVLFVLHQDFWLWDNGNFVFGFLPVGLAYHIGFSLLSAIVWALAIKFAWPSDLEDEVEEAVAEAKQG